MGRSLLLIMLFLSTAIAANAQRTNVLATFQFIDNGKYEEAKKAIEEAIEDKKTMKRSRTWYARGLLCLEAYDQGIKDNDKKKYELYPDQLYVAYESFEKALLFSKSDRTNEQLKPHYVNLLNDFIELGSNHYKQKAYKEAVRAFDNGLRINQSEVLSVELDTSLLYNAAIAAYQGGDREEALSYLSRLNDMHFSPNVTHLMYTIHIQDMDSTLAREVLELGIETYNYNKNLVLLLTDLLYKSGANEEAIILLNKAIAADTANATFVYTKGLVYQKVEKYREAIETYQQAAGLDPANANIYKNMGTCFYNIGVEYDENARTINNNRLYEEEKEKSIEASGEAVKWLEKALQLKPSDTQVRDMLAELYNTLNMTEKLNSLYPD